MQPTESGILLITILGSLVLIMASTFIITFLFYFRDKQIINIQEKANLQSQFAQEILKSQIEVQNHTLQQLGQELHDNIGQLLSVAKINLNILEEAALDSENHEYIKQTNDIISQSINDLRALTKSLDGDFVEQFGLQQSLSEELQRIRKTKKFETEITIEGEAYSLGYEREIILFRIFQEFLNNTIKHSRAKNINVQLMYDSEDFRLRLSDDGKGFDYNEIMARKINQSGSGLRNMARRCELIGGKCEFKSDIGRGTQIEIILQNLNNSNSFEQI